MSERAVKIVVCVCVCGPGFGTKIWLMSSINRRLHVIHILSTVEIMKDWMYGKESKRERERTKYHQPKQANDKFNIHQIHAQYMNVWILFQFCSIPSQLAITTLTIANVCVCVCVWTSSVHKFASGQHLQLKWEWNNFPIFFHSSIEIILSLISSDYWYNRLFMSYRAHWASSLC